MMIALMEHDVGEKEHPPLLRVLAMNCSAEDSRSG